MTMPLMISALALARRRAVAAHQPAGPAPPRPADQPATGRRPAARRTVSAICCKCSATARVGQRSVKLDNETQTLLNRLGWRSARQRSLFAACQIGSPLLLLALALLLQSVFFPAVENQWIAPLFALGVGYLLPKRLLVIAVARRQKQLASEIGTFIPLLRILFESGMAVEQALRVLSHEGQALLPVLT